MTQVKDVFSNFELNLICEIAREAIRQNAERVADNLDLADEVVAALANNLDEYLESV